VEPDPAERVAGEPVQESGEEGPISRGEPRFLAMQLSLEDGDPVAQSEDLGTWPGQRITGSEVRINVTAHTADTTTAASTMSAVLVAS
jgi:hypothetical protein